MAASHSQTAPDSNPLLDFSGLPRFSSISPAHVDPAVSRLIAENRALIERLTADASAPAWDSFTAPLEDASERLSRAWGIVAHLHGVLDSPALREAYNLALPRITDYWSALSQHAGLYSRFKALSAAPEFGKLNREQKKYLENELRDFRLGGAELADAAKQRFKAIQEELAALSAKFSENLLDATNAFSLVVERRQDLAGIPDDVVQTAAAAALKTGGKGWKFTLQAPSYLPFMQYAENRALREAMYRGYVTRASEFGRPEWDNTPLIAAMLKLRREEAQLLGYRNYAEVSLVPKMAKSPSEVLKFLDDLAEKAKPYAERDLRELTAFAATELGLTKLESWDLAFASEKLRARRYAFSDQEVKQYFPEPKVLEGMFRVVETLFGVRIGPDRAETWHPDVRFFRITDAAGRLIGQFYLDLYARDTKRGGAWMDDAIARRRRGPSIQTPVAYLTCNFSAPVGGKPALLTHDEVSTLFHEFGHGLHHLLTRVEELGVSGISGVEWDAVELPSQFMENFCWEWEVLKGMSAHVDTGAALPRALYDKMVAAKNFQSGMQMLRQIEFSVFDLRLHHDFDPDAGVSAQQLLDEVRQQVAVTVPPPWNRFPQSFSHIFGGGYAAGYYSYKWAEVLSADAYSMFEEAGARQAGVLDPATGARFRDEILGVGGSRPALESFVAFRGRAPSVDALLRHSGMIAP
jgi:oligopeptidase A